MLLRWIYLSHFSMSHGLWCWIEKCLFPNQIGLLFCSGAVKIKEAIKPFLHALTANRKWEWGKNRAKSKTEKCWIFCWKAMLDKLWVLLQRFQTEILVIRMWDFRWAALGTQPNVFQKIWKVRIRMKVEWWCVSWGACPSAAHARQVLASCCSPRAASHCGKSLPAVTVSPKHCTWKRSSQKLRRWQRYGDLQAARRYRSCGIPPSRPLGTPTAVPWSPFGRRYTRSGVRQRARLPSRSACWLNTFRPLLKVFGPGRLSLLYLQVASLEQ